MDDAPCLFALGMLFIHTYMDWRCFFRIMLHTWTSYPICIGSQRFIVHNWSIPTSNRSRFFDFETELQTPRPRCRWSPWKVTKNSRENNEGLAAKDHHPLPKVSCLSFRTSSWMPGPHKTRVTTYKSYGAQQEAVSSPKHGEGSFPKAASDDVSLLSSPSQVPDLNVM